MAQIVFRCPNTGQHVQRWTDDAHDSKDDTYQAVECPACIRLHFVNRSTGKLLGEK
jgi:hypothetical protein